MTITRYFKGEDHLPLAQRVGMLGAELAHATKKTRHIIERLKAEGNPKAGRLYPGSPYDPEHLDDLIQFNARLTPDLMELEAAIGEIKALIGLKKE